MNWKDLSFKSICLGILISGCALAAFWGIRSYSRTYHRADFQSATNIENLGIKEVIAKVQDELTQSEMERKKSKKDSLFQVKDFDLEIKFVITTKSSDNQQSSLQLITLDTKAEYSQEKVHQIKLHMIVPEPKAIVVPPSPSIAVPPGKIENLGPMPHTTKEDR